ncbi:uncharacterized protein LOC108324590 [Vigna angularis]|uniref:uncharacterized protein LOC108324590 n=1 Tax=Phaseolus angularis TaxID=3914 RepID=UPI00080A0824|nr:uncharacterized protein LOC108324590 [Vigna angularis]
MANLKLTNQLDEKKVDATLYKQIVGSLRYICNSRPDINYGVGLVSRFMSDPRQSHLATTKHILRTCMEILDELKIECSKPIRLMVDNRSTISQSRNPISHGRSKHIETKFHYLREQVSKEKLELVYCPIEERVADIFIKALGRIGLRS